MNPTTVRDRLDQAFRYRRGIGSGRRLTRSVTGLATGAWLLGLTLVIPAPGQAQDRMYRCDTGQGNPPVFQNAPGPGCRALDLPPLTSVPGTAVPARPRAAATAPAQFPQVDASQQRNRDADRRRILQKEMEREKSRLAEVSREYNGGEPERLGDERNYQKYLERVERLKRQLDQSQSNVGSLQRELDALN